MGITDKTSELLGETEISLTSDNSSFIDYSKFEVSNNSVDDTSDELSDNVNNESLQYFVDTLRTELEEQKKINEKLNNEKKTYLALMRKIQGDYEREKNNVENLSATVKNLKIQLQDSENTGGTLIVKNMINEDNNICSFSSVEEFETKFKDLIINKYDLNSIDYVTIDTRLLSSLNEGLYLIKNNNEYSYVGIERTKTDINGKKSINISINIKEQLKVLRSTNRLEL